jgi:hypothetical protein
MICLVHDPIPVSRQVVGGSSHADSVHKERALMCTRQIVPRLILNICRSLPVKLGGQNTYYYADCSFTRPEITGLCRSLILTMYAQCIVATCECYFLQALRAQFRRAFCTTLQFLRRIQAIQLVISLLHGLGFPFPPNIFSETKLTSD